MKKKLITAVLAVTMAVGMLTGCGSGTGTGKKEASGEKLVIWTNMNVEVDTIQKYADEWGEKNGRKVEVIHQSPSVQQFAQAVKSASGPDAVVGIPNDQLADYVNADLTAEVPQDLYADQDFSDAAIQNNISNIVFSLKYLFYMRIMPFPCFFGKLSFSCFVKSVFRR